MSKTFTIKAIQNVAKHRPEGYLEEVLSSGTVEGEKVTLTDEAYRILAAKYRAPVRPGVGTELKALLSKVGITASPTCS